MATQADPDEGDTAGTEQQALHGAVAGLASSLARLAVAHGLPFAAVEEMMRMAFVRAASQAHPDLPEHRKVSRISTATGINRREVTRLSQQLRESKAAPPRRSLSSEVFAHWRSQPDYRDAAGQPRVLPRQGPRPSFESLAQEITRDVHPRSLLDELLRLGLATWDETDDRVSLARDAFVPQGDRVRMLALLGDNVGDHLRAAVDNVLGDDRMHFEQALFADGLSLASIESIRPAVREQWQALLSALVPVLEARVEADAPLPPAERRRMRLGLYTYQEAAAPPPPPPPTLPAPKAPRAPRAPRASTAKRKT